MEPLSEAVLFILLSLADQPRHGYSILKDVEEMSAGRVLLSTGTLYGALRRLLEDRWIERVKQQDTTRGKVAYQLTGTGLTRVHQEMERMKHLTRLARMRVVTKEA